MGSRALAVLLLAAAPVAQQGVLVEAESFADHGGWRLDTQFVATMGSPYLLAHGLGRPVGDAVTRIELPAAGSWHLFARTYDWVARWGAPGTPGRFRVLVDGEVIGGDLGVEAEDWRWVHAGRFTRAARGSVELRLRDLTGFDGRLDALYFSPEPTPTPPSGGPALARWRRARLGQPAQPPVRGGYDLVVVGGGYAGIAASLAAARLGCRVALIQDRPVLGGNGSSEVRVWAQGGTRRGRYPRLGEIVEEFADSASASPGRAEEFGDAHKERVVRAEPNIDLFLNHRADRVGLAEDDPQHIAWVEAFDTRSGARTRFAGRLFADCTGHGWVGARAGADLSVRTEQHLGASNMWRWQRTGAPVDFPATPWALPLQLDDFPYPRGGKGEWFWESGFDLHPIDDLEAIRDWNLRAVFGAFQALKSGARAGEHRSARLQWVAYVSGTRESRQILGDVVLTRDDIVARRAFSDGCVPTTWDIDLHYPRERYAAKFPENPFISRAHFDRAVDREHGYPVPYRCFYSRNVDNLFMAGRCISVTHQALGTVRVMRTGGMIGEVVGKAAAVCVAEDCTPRAVYRDHWPRLDALLRLPGGARSTAPGAEPTIPAGAVAAGGVRAADLAGIVVDDGRAHLSGSWVRSTHEAGFVGDGYLHDGDAHKGECVAVFTLRARQPGRYAVELTWRTGGNRAERVPVSVRTRGATSQHHIDQSRAPGGYEGFARLGTVELEPGLPVEVTIGNAGTAGHVIVDAVRLRRLSGRDGR